MPSLLLLLAYAGSSLALGVKPGQIKNWVSFGDSYTAAVFGNYNLNGGIAWPYYAAEYATPHINVVDVAFVGATCSNQLTLHSPWPDVVNAQLPLYLAAQPIVNWKPEETLFSIWIGGNDLGVLLSGGQTAGVTVNTTTKCAVDVFKTLHQNGARNFIFMNVSE